MRFFASRIFFVQSLSCVASNHLLLCKIVKIPTALYANFKKLSKVNPHSYARTSSILHTYILTYFACPKINWFMIHNFQQFQRKLKIILLLLSVMPCLNNLVFEGKFLIKIKKEVEKYIEKDHHKIGFRIIWRKPDQMMLQFHHSWKTFQKSFASMIIDLMIQVSYKTFGSPLPVSSFSFIQLLSFIFSIVCCLLTWL